MPRFARPHAPGALVHVIARFVNRQYRFGPQERAAALDRIPAALSRSDWTLLAYALMSNHIHLALLAGQEPPWRFLKPLHTSWAKYLNRAHHALGPVFAERATTLFMEPARLAVLAAYIHHNPVRACVVSAADQSDWTSHRAWVGLGETPGWLAVEQGLKLAGFGDTPQGRRQFHDFVTAHAAGSDDSVWDGVRAVEVRRRVRAAAALPLEVSAPVEEGQVVRHELLYPALQGVAPRWEGDLEVLLEQVAQAAGVSVTEVCSRSHHPRAVRARRLMLVTGSWFLRRELKELAAVLAITSSAASRLTRKANQVLSQAAEIAEAIRGEGPVGSHRPLPRQVLPGASRVTDRARKEDTKNRCDQERLVEEE